MSYPKTASILAALLACSFGGTVLGKNTDSKLPRKDAGAPGLIGASTHSANANHPALSGAEQADVDDLESPVKNIGQGQANGHKGPTLNQSDPGQARAVQQGSSITASLAAPKSSATSIPADHSDTLASISSTLVGSAFAHPGEQIQVSLTPGLIGLLDNAGNGSELATPLVLPVAHTADEPSIAGEVEPGTLRNGPAVTRAANIQNVPDRGNSMVLLSAALLGLGGFSLGRELRLTVR